MVVIREEIPSDIPAIRCPNEEAFGQSTEPSIVDRLRTSCDSLLSLVAVEEGRVVGTFSSAP